MSTSNAPRASGRSAKRSQPASQNRVPLIVGAVVIVVLLIGAGIWLSGSSSSSGEQKIPDLGAGLHLQSPNDPLPKPYNSQPPTSGYHYGGGLAPWGIQTQHFPDTLSVHNIEHGGVIIHYREGLDQSEVNQLTTIARKLQQRNPCLLMEPRPADQINAPIALTAWNYLLELQQPDEKAITNFFVEHVGRGPEQACPAGAN